MQSLATSVKKYSFRGNFGIAVTGLLGGTILLYLILTGHVRVAITVTVALVFIMLAVMRIQAAIIAGIVYVTFMGDLRKLLIPIVGWAEMDPLLLIVPAFTIALFAYALASQVVRLDTHLSRLTAALMVVMILQMFNPQQGGLMVGVAGAMFYLIPILWFWVGRTYATPDFMKTLLFKVVVGLAIMSALMGLYQTFYGYLPHQELWYQSSGYKALGSEGIQAPISFFSSSTEYASYLLIAIVALWSLLVKQQRYTTLLLIAPLFAAVFLTGIRGPIAKFVLTAAGLWAVLGDTKLMWMTRGAFALVVGILVLGMGLGQLEGIEGNRRLEHRVERQRQGLLGIASEGSSANNHLEMMMHGLLTGFQTPLGLGLGATTKAAAKFDGQGGSTETDISDVFVSTGLIGGLIYLVMVYLIVRTALRYWLRTRSVLALCLLGILIITLLGWLRGGRYAVTPLIWLCVGALDRFENVEGT